MALRKDSFGINGIIAEPWPQKKITTLRPIVNSKAVPINSDSNKNSMDFSVPKIHLCIYHSMLMTLGFSPRHVLKVGSTNSNTEYCSARSNSKLF